MANYYGYARSNYIKFDPDKLAALQVLFPITVVDGEDGRQALLSADEAGTPNCVPDIDEPNEIVAATVLGYSDLEDMDGLSLLEVVHLAFADDPDDGLFVWQEVGFEKMRYLTGVAMAIDATGEIVNRISISDVHSWEGVQTLPQY